MKYVLTVAIIVAVLGVGALLYAWSGIYNIAATKPHWAVTLSFIQALRDRSIAVRSDDIRTPNLDDDKLKQAAFSHYHGMCRFCHGAPEYPPKEFAEGLYPAPPSMISGSIQKARSDVEIFWIVKHGIKMTGMPAFDPTHREAELWGLVALVKEMPRMSPERYRKLARATASKMEMGQRHTHGEPTAGKEQGRNRSEREPSAHGEAEQDHH